MSDTKIDLSSLVVSQETIATDGILRALKGLVSIVKETGEVLPNSAFGKLSNNQKILTYFLGLRAGAILGLGNKKVSSTAEEIAVVIGCDVQRTREFLSRLKGRFLQKTEDGWQLPTTRISEAAEEIINARN